MAAKNGAVDKVRKALGRVGAEGLTLVEVAKKTKLHTGTVLGVLRYLRDKTREVKRVKVKGCVPVWYTDDPWA